MADVRSLLRSELASRGSSAQAGSAGTRIIKKRKIEGTDLPVQSIRKKSRPTTPALSDTVETEAESVKVDYGPEVIAEEEHIPQEKETDNDNAGAEIQHETKDLNEQKIPIASNTVDEDEWAAFERDVVAPTHLLQVPAATVAAATISAAPITADDLAIQQQKQKEEQARAQEEDIEDEKEDAARLLEEEFEEMEQLEERVKRLKAKREELRTQESAEDNSTAIEVQETTQQDVDESEDDDDDSDWDDWRFR